MEDRVNSIVYGRPYGGCAILVHSKFSKLIKHVTCSERYVIILLGSIALVNVYFPCRSNLKAGNFMDITNNMIDEITSI